MDMPDLSLPTELNLDDWPFAKMVFSDLYFEDVGGTRIEAEIYSLSPVEVTPLPGDYNYDGEGERQRLRYGWSYESSFDLTTELYADGNGDGTVDAADYVVWRRALASSVLQEWRHLLRCPSQLRSCQLQPHSCHSRCEGHGRLIRGPTLSLNWIAGR